MKNNVLSKIYNKAVSAVHSIKDSSLNTKIYLAVGLGVLGYTGFRAAVGHPVNVGLAAWGGLCLGVSRLSYCMTQHDKKMLEQMDQYRDYMANGSRPFDVPYLEKTEDIGYEDVGDEPEEPLGLNR
jgi:hypothetical protein